MTVGDWQVEFFKDPRSGRVPGREFLQRIPDEPAAELLAPGLPHHAIVVIDGDVKRNETAFGDQFYADRRAQWEIHERSNPRSVE